MVTPVRWILRGWDWFVQDLGIFILIGLLACVLTSFSLFLVTGPVAAGLARVSLSKARGGRVDVNDFFDGFRHFGPAFLASLVIALMACVGLVFLIIPGLVVLAMYTFTFHIMVDHQQDYWRALSASRDIAARDYFGFTIFASLLVGGNLLGLAFMGIGVIITVPITALSISAAYLSLRGEGQDSTSS